MVEADTSRDGGCQITSKLDLLWSVVVLGAESKSLVETLVVGFASGFERLRQPAEESNAPLGVVALS